MNTYLESTPYPHSVQLVKRLEPPIQALNGCQAVVDSLPLWRLDRLGDCLLVGRIRFDNRGSLVLVPNDPSDMVTGVSSIGDDVLRAATIGVTGLAEQLLAGLHRKLFIARPKCWRSSIGPSGRRRRGGCFPRTDSHWSKLPGLPGTLRGPSPCQYSWDNAGKRCHRLRW